MRLVKVRLSKIRLGLEKHRDSDEESEKSNQSSRYFLILRLIVRNLSSLG